MFCYAPEKAKTISMTKNMNILDMKRSIVQEVKFYEQGSN